MAGRYLSKSSTAASKDKKTSEDWELYLGCVGRLMGLEFEPGPGLKLLKQEAKGAAEEENGDNDQNQSRRTKNDEKTEEPPAKESVLKGVSTKMAKTWKAGGITATLRKLGIPPKRTKSTTGNTAMDQFIFRFPSTVLAPARAVVPAAQSNRNQADDPNLRNVDPALLKPFRCPVLKGPEGSKNNDIYPRNTAATSTSARADPINPPPNHSRGLFGSSSIKNPSANNANRSNNSTRVEEIKRQEVVTLDSNSKKEESEVKSDTPSFKFASSLVKRDRLGTGTKRKDSDSSKENPAKSKRSKKDGSDSDGDSEEDPELAELMEHKQLKVFEKKLVEAVLNEVMEHDNKTQWDDIAGLKGPKRTINEIVVWPLQRPDIFTGLRAAAKGILLFGPPGTGKTMIGRVIAAQSQSTFFNISASTLTSKWIGDGEKMVRCLFQIARIKQPSVIFIDEIDSILTHRSDTEHESSRRMKTEFLIQFDGCGTSAEDKVLVIGVTNRPQELDEAARRRLVKRIYIPLPDFEGRIQIINNLMKDQSVELSEEEKKKITDMTAGYSGADMKTLCQEASYGPIRDIGHILQNIDLAKVRPIKLKDFKYAMKRVKPSVCAKDLHVYEKWDKLFGCHTKSPAENSGLESLEEMEMDMSNTSLSP